MKHSRMDIRVTNLPRVRPGKSIRRQSISAIELVLLHNNQHDHRPRYYHYLTLKTLLRITLSTIRILTVRGILPRSILVSFGNPVVCQYCCCIFLCILSVCLEHLDLGLSCASRPPAFPLLLNATQLYFLCPFKTPGYCYCVQEGTSLLL